MNPKLLFLLLCLPSFSASQASDYSFESSVHADFVFLTPNSPPSLGLMVTQVSDTNPSPTRSIGLSRFAVDLNLQHQNSELFVQLRPDYSLDRNGDGSSPIREFDSRSGTTYQASPVLRLLDIYELHVFKSDTFTLSYGIQDRAFSSRHAYRSLLDFGLETWFPRKFASLAFQWNAHQDSLMSLEQVRGPKYQFKLFTIESNEDRHEIYGAEDASNDSGPISTDPHTGLALNFTYYPSESFFAQAFTAYQDSPVDFGRKNQMIYAINSVYLDTLINYDFILSFDGRYSRESWELSQGQSPTLSQSSMSLRAKMTFEPRWSAFIGYHRGTSDHTSETLANSRQVHRGEQLDLGVVHQIYPHLNLDFVLTDELRKIEEGGVSLGGFTVEGEASNRISRFALRISYRNL